MLVVDDEPDVLSVTKLALRNASVYDVPLKIHTAESKAAALEILSTTLATRLPAISMAAVIFLDVVMETDQAGLELCQHIRETMNNRITQIYIRTGQPGTAPQRAVVDRYDISGYLAKSEASEEKLYSLVKSGVRQYTFSCVSLGLFNLTRELVACGDSREAMGATMTRLIGALAMDAGGAANTSVDVALCLMRDDEMVAGTWPGGEAEAGKAARPLRESPARKLGESDRYLVDGNSFIVEMAPGEKMPTYSLMARGTAPAPEFQVPLYHSYTLSLGLLWHRAR